MKKDVKWTLTKANPVSDVYILPYTVVHFVPAVLRAAAQGGNVYSPVLVSELFALWEWAVDGLLCDIITVIKYWKTMGDVQTFVFC